MSKSPSLRRIKADIRELSIDPSDQYHAAPLEHDMFEWHFTIRGAEDTDFAGGVYHGRILLPPEYPFKPPNIVFLTPSGRFECGVKVCLSFSAHHPELWQPAWGIRLILEALISFLPTPADGALGALDWTSEERKKLAKGSVKFRCPICCGEGETCVDLLPIIEKAESGEKKKTKFQEEIEKLKMLQFQNHTVDEGETKKERESNKKEDGGGDQKEASTDTDGGEKKQEALSQPPAPTPEQQSGKKEALEDGNGTKDSGEPSSAAGRPSPPTAAPQQTTNNTTTTIQPPRNAPNPTPLPANNNAVVLPAPPGSITIPAPPAAAVNNTNNNNNNVDAPIVSDRVLNTMIAFFAVVVAYLLREAQQVVGELHSLGGSYVMGDGDGEVIWDQDN